MKSPKWNSRIWMSLLLVIVNQTMGYDFTENEAVNTMENDEALYFFVPGPFMGFYYFEYQKALAPKHSVNIAAEFADFKYQGNGMIRLWGIYRYKLIENQSGPLEGVFLTPALQVAQPLDRSVTILNTLFYLSYQQVYANGFSVQYFAGVGYGMPSNKTERYKMYTGLSPSSGVSLGYTF
jgi:hypothetical protein